MTDLERWLCIRIVFLVMTVVGGLSAHAYGAHRYNVGHVDGYNAAVATGKEQHDRDAAAAKKTESDLRAQLAAQDAGAHQREIEHAKDLADAQRRVRAGTDRLRCPAGPVQPTAAPGDRLVASGPETDGGGPDLVPEAAADVLGYGAAIAGLVSRYERLEQRFEDCRAVNAGP